VEKAKIAVTALEVTGAPIIEGKAVTVNVTAKNDSTVDGTYSAVLKVNGLEKRQGTVEVKAGGSSVTPFEVIFDTAGIYQLSVDNQSKSVSVNGAGLLGQSLALLNSKDGKIVSSELIQSMDSGKVKIDVYKIRYLSDGLEVIGYIFKPADDGRYPTLIYNRPGLYGMYLIGGSEPSSSFEYLASLSSNGYAVIASQIRGNDGGQGQEDFGVKDVNDVLNLIKTVDSMPLIFNPERMGMVGFSMGGTRTYIAMQKTDKIKAAAVVGGTTDRCDQIEKMNAPVLILHGASDSGISVAQVEQLAAKLKDSGKQCELVVYPKGSHLLNENAQDRDARIIAWLNKYLK
jgi:dipeptidyl aminopeptidase/acylaminoacyl peptidase